MFTDGIEFINLRPGVVSDFLKKRKLEIFACRPSDLSVKNDGKNLMLHLPWRQSGIPLRRTFLYKLLKWYHFPINQLSKLSADTAASVCNDYLLQIKHEFVNIKTENDEALTITSPGYSEISDLEIIEKLSDFGVSSISRNDFMLRVNTKMDFKFTINKGDDFAAGITVTNSETGFRKLGVSHFILRLVCTNGAVAMIDRDDSSRTHYGCSEKSLSDFLAGQILLADLKKSRVAASIKKLSEMSAHNQEIILQKVNSVTGKRFRPAHDASQYDLFNFITDEAKRYDLSRRIALETIAGEMLGEINLN